MADTQIDPFAGAIVADDDSNKPDPFAGAIVMGDAPVIDDIEETEPVNENVFQYIDDNPDLIGTAVELPNPSTTMYEDITNEGGFLGGLKGRNDVFRKALARYDFYKEHPDSRRQLDGTLVYNNKVVPRPNQGFSGDMDVDLTAKMIGGVKNAGVEIMATGEMITDLAGVTDPNTTYIRDNFATLGTGDSTMDSVITEGSSLLTGGGIFAKIFGKAPQIGKYGTTILKGLGFEIGAASSISSDAGTLLIGNKAMMDELGWQPAIFEGMDVDATDNKAQQELAKRMNILMDGMTAAGVVTGAIKGVDFTARTLYNIFVDPLASAGSVSKMETDFMRTLLDELVNVGDDPKAIEAARIKVTELITANKDLYVDLPEELAASVQISVDSMTALERALRADDSEVARDIIMTAQGKKKGVTQTASGTNQTNLAVSRPTDELERVLNEAETNLGGGVAIDDTARALQDQGVKEIDNANLAVAQAEDNFANLNTRIVQELTEDPSLIGKVTDLESRTGFDIGSVRENSADDIVSNLSKASESMDTTKNDLFAAVKGGEVDYVSMVTKLRGLKPNQLDAAAAAMPGNSQFGTLLEQTKLRTKMVDDKPVVETIAEMEIRVAKWAGNNGVDFARLFTDIRPGLVDSINSLEFGNAAEKGAAKTLIQFKKWIDEDAIKYLKENGDDETLEAAEEAMAYFKNEWAPFWDDGSTLQQVGALRRQTIGRGKQGAKFDDEARGLVTGTINDTNRSVAANMIKLLDRPEAGESAASVTDFIIGDILSTISTRLDSTEKLSDLGLDSVRQGLSRYSTLIRKNFGQEADRLDALVAKLSDTKLTKEQLQREIVEAQRLAKEAEERIYNQELNGFFKGQGIPNPNGYDTLSKIFNGQQSGDQITQLMARAEGDPVIEAGMQAAYTRWFRNNFLGSTTSTAGERTLKLGAEMANSEGVKNAFDYANIVFKNKPKFVEALDILLEEATGVQRARASKAIPTGSGTAELTEQVAAVNRGVTATLGVLSRIGARIRTTAVGAIQQNFDKNRYFNMVDNLMANPDEFVRVAEDVIRLEKEVGTIPIRIPFTRGKKIPDKVPFVGGKEPVYYLDRGAMYKMMVRAGIYREGNDAEQREFYEILAQTELDFTRARDEFIQSQELGIK